MQEILDENRTIVVTPKGFSKASTPAKSETPPKNKDLPKKNKATPSLNLSKVAPVSIDIDTEVPLD